MDKQDRDYGIVVVVTVVSLLILALYLMLCHASRVDQKVEQYFNNRTEYMKGV